MKNVGWICLVALSAAAFSGAVTGCANDETGSSDDQAVSRRAGYSLDGPAKCPAPLRPDLTFCPAVIDPIVEKCTAAGGHSFGCPNTCVTLCDRPVAKATQKSGFSRTGPTTCPAPLPADQAFCPAVLDPIVDECAAVGGTSFGCPNTCVTLCDRAVKR